MDLFQHLDAAILRAPLHPVGHRADAFNPGSRFRHGLRLAAPGFLNLLDAANAAGYIDAGLHRSLLKYQLRASGRCTPFGFFAGLGILRAGDSSAARVVLSDPSGHRAHPQLDVVVLDRLAARFGAHPAPGLRYRTNTSLYRAGRHFRFAGARTDSGNVTYDLNAVPAGALLAGLLDAASAGCDAADLLRLILTGSDVTVEDARDYLAELIDSQLLIPELAPPLTGSDSLRAMSEAPGAGTEPKAVMGRLQHLLCADFRSEAAFAAVRNELDAVLAGRTAEEPDLQLDMYLDCTRTALPKARLDRLASALEALTPLALPYALPQLASFKAAFAARYEGAAVPLLEALDPDLGIGYVAQGPAAWTGALLGALPIPELPAFPPSGSAPVSAFIRRRFLDALRDGCREIVLTDADLRALPHTGNPEFPKTQSLLGSMSNGSTPDDWLFSLDYAGGASAIGLIGRFCNGSTALADLASALASIEAAAEPHCILAEIVHLPAASLGNISRRPVFREFEIPYLGKSGTSADRQIDPADLLLQLHGDELCVFSRRLGKRVLPRLSTAHNFTADTLPVYRLLCELQFQGLSQPLAWDWGEFRDEAFLPGVRYDHILIRRPSWGFDANTIGEIPVTSFSDALRHRGVPDRVRCGSGDQQLLIDTREPEQVDLLLRELKRNPRLRVEAAHIDEFDPFVRDEAGRAFVAELVIPLVNATHRPTKSIRLRMPGDVVRRSFQPGFGGWHYIRLYCGYAAADELLRGGLAACCEELLAAGIITHWFFLRYMDDEPHLRLRFYLPEPAGRTAVETALRQWLEPLLEDGILHRIVVDTYQREIERYGPEAIAQVEQLFFFDSTCTLAVLNAAGEAPPDESARFAFACSSISALLRDAGLDQQEQAGLLSALAGAFFEEHGGGIPLQQALNARYRELRSALDAWTGTPALSGYGEPLAVRSVQNRAVFEAFGSGAAGLRRVLPHLLHLVVNRIFQAAQRRYELLIYHCLARHLRSKCARQQHGVSGSACA